MSIVSWENPEHCGPVRLCPSDVIVRASLRVKAVALAKLFDVELISASFNGQSLVFQPSVLTLIDHGARATFIGAYSAAYPSGDFVGGMPPTLCIRTAEYDRQSDYAQFERALNKREYLLSGQVIGSRLLFSRHSDCEDAVRLMTNAGDIVRSGVSLTGKANAQEAPRLIRVSVLVDGIEFNSSFLSGAIGGTQLDAWLVMWQTSLVDLGMYRPQCEFDVSDITFSYRQSLFDRFIDFPDGPGK